MTPEQTKSAVATVQILAEAIREAKEIPSGHLYALCMDRLSLDQYEGAIGILKRTGLVSEKSHLLKWNEPEKKKEKVR
jgi:2-hydroxychromene-2-carboxylate isomerase